MFVCAMIEVKETQQKTTKVGDNRVPVCKSMFTNSLDLKWSTIKRWIANYSSFGAVSNDEDALLFSEVTISNLEEHTPLAQKNQQQYATLQTELSPVNLRRETMKMFLEEIPKLPSHYCRQSSSKLYLYSHSGYVEDGLSSIAKLMLLTNLHVFIKNSFTNLRTFKHI
ncbi:Uncharacterized protein FWK35_00011915 [Aphis craccivora]|uniref:Uncharacterized protein n=1 Tax=Aphis craccivora TaxID=307492 RepID=A0A6G0Y1N9_APHCR|nr:Uncharacterized protein FWK35_00011915 [Aphis craccivora]